MSVNTIDATETLKVFGFTTAKEIINQTLCKSEYFHLQKSNITGVPSGFQSLDNITKGFQNGTLTTITVQAGMGKTALLLSLVNNIAVNLNKPIGVFTMERSASKFIHRLIENETGCSINKLINGNVKEGERAHHYSVINNIANAGIYIDDNDTPTLDELSKNIHSLKEKHGIQVVFIDHLELFISPASTITEREEQMQNITAALKKIAKSTDLPIVLFTQTCTYFANTFDFVRPSEKDMPLHITKNADSIMLVNRHKTKPIINGSKHALNEVEILIFKHPALDKTHSVMLHFVESIGKFTD